MRRRPPNEWDRFLQAASAAWEQVTPRTDTDEIYKLFADVPDFYIPVASSPQAPILIDADDSNDAMREISAEVLRSFRRRIGNDARSLGFIWRGLYPCLLLQQAPFGKNSWRCCCIAILEPYASRLHLRSHIGFAYHQPGRTPWLRRWLSRASLVVLLVSVALLLHPVLMRTVFAPVQSHAESLNERKLAEWEQLVEEPTQAFREIEASKREQAREALRHNEYLLARARIGKPEDVDEAAHVLHGASTRSLVEGYRYILRDGDAYIGSMIENLESFVSDRVRWVEEKQLSDPDETLRVYKEYLDGADFDGLVAVRETVTPRVWDREAARRPEQRARVYDEITTVYGNYEGARRNDYEDDLAAFVDAEIGAYKQPILYTLSEYRAPFTKDMLLIASVSAGALFAGCTWLARRERKRGPGYNLSSHAHPMKMRDVPAEARGWTTTAQSIAMDVVADASFGRKQGHGAEMF